MQITQNLCEKENRPVVNIESWPAVCQSLVRYDVGIAQWPAVRGQQLFISGQRLVVVEEEGKRAA